jgi:tRNA-binding EMAP/Myf-like protein
VTDLVVGRVLDARDHPGARAPSFLVRLDLGPRGEYDAQMEPGDYTHADLLGRLVVVAVEDTPIVVSARSHGRGPVLIGPDGDVEPGTVVA